MLLTYLPFLIYASTAVLAQQTPITYDTAHNVTAITGTWSSGSGNVTTGSVRMFVRLLWHSLIRGMGVDLCKSCQRKLQIPHKYGHIVFIVRRSLRLFREPKT